MHLARLASAIVIICLHGGNRCFQPADMLKFAKHSVCFDAFVRHMASVARKESPTTFQEAKTVLHITKARFHAFPLSLMVNPRRFCTGFHVSRADTHWIYRKVTSCQQIGTTASSILQI